MENKAPKVTAQFWKQSRFPIHWSAFLFLPSFLQFFFCFVFFVFCFFAPLGFPWWSSGWDSTLPVHGPQVQALVKELELRNRMSQQRMKCAVTKIQCSQINNNNKKNCAVLFTRVFYMQASQVVLGVKTTHQSMKETLETEELDPWDQAGEGK